MSYSLNKKLSDLNPYTVDTKYYPVKLDANESFLQPPEDIRAAVRLAMEQVKYNRYPDPLASRVRAFYGDYYEVNPKLLTAANGSDELISLLISAFLEKGDTIATMDFDFSMYDFYAHIAEMNIVKCGKREDFTVDVDRVIRTVQNSGAGMLIFSNPCNPTSLGIGREEIIHIIKNVDALVVLDEAYMDFWDQSLLGQFEQYENLVILRTCSKMMGFAAVRLGFAASNRTITDALQAAKSPFNVNALTQAAASAVLAHKQYIDSAIGQILQSKTELLEKINKLGQRYGFPVYESCTNFITLRPQKADQIFEWLKDNGILVRCIDGTYLRITCGTKEENQTVAGQLDNILLELSEK